MPTTPAVGTRMNNSRGPSLLQTSNTHASTLRPRNARLISYNDEEPTEHTINPSASNPSSLLNQRSPFPSRGVSPLPSHGRARSTPQHNYHPAGQLLPAETTSANRPSTPTGGIWESWSALQGIASSLLGSDVQKTPKAYGNGVRKTSARQNKSISAIPSQPLEEWGPSTTRRTEPVSGTIEERQALVQAKKREALLLANVNEWKDVNGRFKRRDSTSHIATADGTGDQGEDALVYFHKIQPEDTLAGVTIKYSCQPEVFRKVNRFWPNDNIQTRTHVFLPVDVCSIRGRKTDCPDHHFDLLFSDLATEPMADIFLSAHNGPAMPSYAAETVSSPLGQQKSTSSSSSSLPEDSRHESWVELPGFANTVEILRIPRRTLGYFPPARRKSITNPDVSQQSTPKSSFDMLRHPPTHAASLNASPVRRTQVQHALSRQRSASTANPSTFSFVDHLKGPGGVGTLRGLRTEAPRPGPGEDPLNKKFAAYLPDLAPPEDFPRTSLRPVARGTPRASTDSTRSTSSTGLGEVGGAIEGWVRKLAAGSSKGSRAGLSARMGDLIELETNSDMGDLLEDAGEQTPTLESTSTFATLDGAQAQSTATEEALLNERFPVRGRVRAAYAGTVKDKDD